MERQGVIWYATDNPTGYVARKQARYSIDEPCVTVMAGGMGGDWWHHWHLERNGSPMQTPPRSTPGKPPYAPLQMAAVRAAPYSGLTHVSTFSGTGGTCLGFRLAGFRTLLANDIDDHARQCYAANLESPIDGRDIRHLTAADILAATGLAPGALDVFEGSPPCTAFSTAGRRAKGWGETKAHAGHVQSNVEDLFFEWLRVLDGLRPRAFVAENVSGMVKGVAKGYFKDVLKRMKALGYQTAAQLLDAQWLGVPQRRGRVIFIGMRDDLGTAPRFPLPLPYRYSVRDALPWLTAAKWDMRGQFAGDPEFIDKPCPTIIGSGDMSGRNAGHYLVQDGAFPRKFTSGDEPSPTVMAGRTTELRQQDDRDSGGGPALVERRKFTITEVKRLCSFPDDFVLTGTFAKQWARLGNSVPPLMAYAIGVAVRDVLLDVEGRAAGTQPAERKGRST
jgi:DNA (cytosine-5)-methyltransferase 1